MVIQNQETSQSFFVKHKEILGQFIRFAIIGGINTVVDIVILNVLSKITHIGIHDPGIVYLNIIAFSVATINSYILNKYWSFHDQSGNKSRQFALFLLISCLGALINTGVLKGSVVLIPGFIAWIAQIIITIVPLEIWNKIDLTLNIAKAIAIGVSLIWNFIGYKLIVFKK